VAEELEPIQNPPALFHLFGFAVAFDAGEHDAPKVRFEKTMGLGDGFIELSALLKFALAHFGLAEQFGGGFGAIAADGIQFKNDSGRAADG